MLSDLISLLRPKHWVKNGFVLAPLIFAGQFTSNTAVMEAIIAFILFSIGASAVYVVNDIRDIESDRRHPTKVNKRPLASGRLSVPQAIALLVLLYGLLGIGYFIQPEVVGVIIAYLLLNYAYSYYLKYQPVLDIFTIALGFVLRVYAGAVAIGAPMTSWTFITTLMLALFLGSIKRRQELMGSGDEGRAVLNQYTLSIVDRYAEMSAIGSLIFYSLFVMSTRPELVGTIPFVIFGLFRYWFIVESKGSGESPTETLLKDPQLLINIALWISFTVWKLWPVAV
ncbi:MAG: decaprenyl-phosphate phosphoribosyltransferase [Gammaproteobacteria bacterium]|nr:decaprenyl-phosphate phosphoribosyltransferase [Gammaproteobacteria bacterium]MCW8888061.1 decaprenyl-phosphate phosphoribosyltransferase [Gammaproteobacteria bacterium]